MNYVHYIWPMCSILTALGFIVLLLQVCYCVIPSVVGLSDGGFPRKNMFIFFIISSSLVCKGN